MKQILSAPIHLIVLFYFLLAGCSKDEILRPHPIPGGGTPPPVFKGSFRFQTNADLTGQPYHSSNLQAVVSIVNSANEPVVSEKTLQLDLSQAVKTESIELPVGNYRLTGFRMVYGGVHTHFAAPLAGSAKASLVQQPLAIEFKVEKDGLKEIPLEIIKVGQGEKPQAWGYPSGAFDNGQSDADPYMRIRLRAIMQIGDVLYDSIPSALTLTTWHSNGEMATSYSSLKAGVNEVPVLKSAARYEFRISKWGTTDHMILERKDLDEATVYTLGGSKEAKKLRSERLYRQVNGAFLPESKTDYFYDGSGKLSRIEYWLKKPDNSNYLSMTEEFEYLAGKVARISRFDKLNNTAIGATAFSYDNQGRVSSMTQTENGKTTNASVAYLPSEQQVQIHYTYPGSSLEMNYSMLFSTGNMIVGAAYRTNQDNETARYDHDLNINPYRHMNWPNLFLSNSSKNNITVQMKEYTGSYPVSTPYNFRYTYDAEGYPAELIRDFRFSSNGQYAFSTKTVFVY